MSSLPHHYTVVTSCSSNGNLLTTGSNLPALDVAPPTNFGGPGNLWSPEDLLVASASTCLILSFKAVARMSNFNWLMIDCETEGVLDKVDRLMQFTRLDSRVHLVIPSCPDKDAARETAGKLLEKAEATCLVSNSLKCPVHLSYEIEFAGG